MMPSGRAMITVSSIALPVSSSVGPMRSSTMPITGRPVR